MKTLTKSDISDAHRRDLTTQDYSRQEWIEGVTVDELRTYSDGGGLFMEVARLTDRTVEGSGFEPRQISYSVMEPGAIKAWHLHVKQDDLWFVSPLDKLVVCLVDCRKDSPTEGINMRFTMGDGKAKVLRIPKGVAHGVANLTNQRCSLMYMTDEQFDASDPDEHRLPWDHFGPEFWEMPKG